MIASENVAVYDNNRKKRKEVKRVVRRAKREADARWGKRLCQNFEKNKNVFWKDVRCVRKGEILKEEVVKYGNG